MGVISLYLQTDLEEWVIKRVEQEKTVNPKANSSTVLQKVLREKVGEDTGWTEAKP